MPTLTPMEIRKELEVQLGKIESNFELLPEINVSNSLGNPYIEIDQYGYHYVCRDREDEVFRKLPFDIVELSYEVFKDICWSLASKWVSENRVESEEFIRIVRKKQVELISSINQGFGIRLIKEQNSGLWAR